MKAKMTEWIFDCENYFLTRVFAERKKANTVPPAQKAELSKEE